MKRAERFLKVIFISLALSMIAVGAAFAKTIDSLALTIDPEINIGNICCTQR
ncbi:hypothetical protein [Oribacterium sp. NK2B42]|uniref:hypothetical protein n=1 Tax=Oribacterium sp. NK2B42 TaxID=689781 RepID=UPI0003FC4781|nr:hypothetical protein [Oribacterium sp. NK2B42]